MSSAYAQIIISAKDQATGVFRTASRQIGTELANVRNRVFSLQNAFVGLGASMALGEIFETGRELEQLDKTFVEITGSVSAAGSEFEFLHKTADNLGQNYYVLADAYKEVMASARGSNLEGEQSREIFTGLVTASASLGLSSDQTAGAIKAVTQMISKGKVQAEELRGQLGERLPGAFQLAAEAMGVSTEKLNKMLELGQVTAEEMLPRLARVLREKYTGEVSEAVRASNKWAEAWKDAKAEIARSGFLESMSAGITSLSGELQSPAMQKALQDLGAGMGSLVEHGADLIPHMSDLASGLDDVAHATGGLLDVYSQFPDEITSGANAGIITRLLTGSTPLAVAVTTLVSLNQAMESLNTTFGDMFPSMDEMQSSWSTYMQHVQNIQDVLSGKRDWNTGELLDQSRYRATVDWSATHPDEPQYHAKVNWSATHPDKDATDKRLADSHDIHEKWMQRRGELLTEWERKAEKTSEKVARDLSMSASDEAAYWHAAMYGNEPIDAKRADRRGDNVDDEIAEMQAVFDEKQRILDTFATEHARATMSASEYAIMQLDQERKEFEEVVTDKVALDQWYAAERANILRMYGEETKDWSDGAKEGLEEFQEDAMDVAGSVESIMYDSLNGVSDCIADFVATGKASWNDLAQSVVHSITEMTTEYLMAQALMGGGTFSGGNVGGLIGMIGGMISGGSSFNVGGAVGTSTGTGGGFNMGVGVVSGLHGGGVVGSEATFHRSVDMAMFQGAPRFHNGLLPDEFPAILKRGEGVFTEGQMKALSAGDPTEIRVVNNFYVQPDSGGNISQKSQRQISRAVTQAMGRYR
jgi:tape measure domain-containing protein